MTQTKSVRGVAWVVSIVLAGLSPDAVRAEEGEAPPAADPWATEPAPVEGPAPAPAAAVPAPAEAAATSGTAPVPAPQEPPPEGVPPAPSAEAAEGEEGEEEHVGRHNRLRLFYLEASGGYTWVKLGQFRSENLVPDVTRIDTQGPAVGGGLGFFVSAFTIGVQAEVSFHDAFKLGTLAFDLGFRIPTPHLEPYLRLGLGYAWMFDLNFPGVTGLAGLNKIQGVVFDLGLGLDYMITELIAIGVGADFGGFYLRRNGDPLGSVSGGIDFDEASDGDSIGVQISLLAQVSLHF